VSLSSLSATFHRIVGAKFSHCSSYNVGFEHLLVQDQTNERKVSLLLQGFFFFKKNIFA
jgi:hypothetical protein